MKKNLLIKATLFTGILFLNSGCFFGMFGEEPKPKVTTPTLVQKTSNIQTRNIQTTTQSNILKASSNLTIPDFNNITTECTDNEGADNGCHKKLISPTELPVHETTATNNKRHELRSFQGKKITVVARSNGYLFPKFGDKIVILEMFGKNCPHCIKEIPTMNRLRKRYRNNLEIVAIEVDGKLSARSAKSFIRRHRIHYPLIPGDSARNLQYHIQTTFEWTGILPFMMVIKDGVTEFTYKGEVSYRRINKDIRSLLP